MVDEKQNRWNFYVLLIQGGFKSVGYELTSAKLVLPFIYSALGGPLLFAGMLMPIVDFSKFVVQIVSATLIEIARVTKWYLGLATTIHAVMLALVCMISGGIPPYWLVVFFLTTACVFGMSMGFASLAFQDLLGRVLAESHRASLLLIGGAITGVFVIVSALGSTYLMGGQDSDQQFSLIWIGAGMLFLASLAIIAVREQPKSIHTFTKNTTRPDKRNSYVTELRLGLKAVSSLAWFRRFLIARLLLLSVELAMPFFATHAAAYHADTAPNLSIFVISSSIGMVLGGIVWPPFSKKSIRLVMSAAAFIASLPALLALITNLWPEIRSPLTYSVMFVLLSFATQGIRAGRTAYIVGAASYEERPYCLAVSNSIASVAGLLLALAVGSISHLQGIIFGLVCMGCLNVAAALYVWSLVDVRHPAISDDDSDSAALPAGAAPSN